MLPLSSVGAALVHFCLQSIAFAVVLVVTRHAVDWSYMWLLPIAVATCLDRVRRPRVLLAPLNVYARDTMHLLELLVLGWFWVTPILYQYERAARWFSNHGLGEWVLLVNPATPIVITFQRAIYGTRVPPTATCRCCPTMARCGTSASSASPPSSGRSCSPSRCAPSTAPTSTSPRRCSSRGSDRRRQRLEVVPHLDRAGRLA